MNELARLIISVAVAGVALTLLGGGVIWSMDETRRIRRSLRKVLGENPHSLLIARGRGRGVGCNFTTNHVAVTWDAGAWCLVYRLEELIGAELVVDGRVEARAWRGEERRPLDRLSGADSEVRLRLVFDDPRHPDFNLPLWLPEDEERKHAMTAPEAVQEANRWLALTESVLRRPAARRASASVAAAPQPPSPRAVPPEPAPPPWDEDESDPEPVD